MTEDEKREKLIGLIREGANGHTFMPIERIADHLIANGVTIQQWIPVEKQLPERNGRYLCNVESSVFPGKFYQAIRMCDKHGFREGNIYTDDVTHWMPMPKPPKEE